MLWTLVLWQLPDWFTPSNVLGFVAFVFIVAGAYLILKSRSREEALASAEKLAGKYKEERDQLDRELKLLIDKHERLTRDFGELREEKEVLDTAYTALSAVTLSEVVTFFKEVIRDVRYINNLVADRQVARDEVARLSRQWAGRDGAKSE